VYPHTQGKLFEQLERIMELEKANTDNQHTIIHHKDVAAAAERSKVAAQRTCEEVVCVSVYCNRLQQTATHE